MKVVGRGKKEGRNPDPFYKCHRDKEFANPFVQFVSNLTTTQCDS